MYILWQLHRRNCNKLYEINLADTVQINRTLLAARFPLRIQILNPETKPIPVISSNRQAIAANTVSSSRYYDLVAIQKTYTDCFGSIAKKRDRRFRVFLKTGYSNSTRRYLQARSANYVLL